MFGHTYRRALESLESSETRITRLEDEFGLAIIKYESANDTYYVYPDVFVCSCPAYKRDVLLLQKLRLCKHVIGHRIAVAFDDGSVTTQFLHSDQLMHLYLDMDHCTITPAEAAAAHTADAGAGGAAAAGNTSTDSVPDNGQAAAAAADPAAGDQP